MIPANNGISKLKQISFLPEPDFNPRYPNRNTLACAALLKMLSGEAINHIEFINEVGSWRLAAVIHNLKKLGWPIESYDRPARTYESPNRYISYYFLPHEIIKLVNGGGVCQH